MHNMNIQHTQQEILHLLTQSETLLQNLLDDNAPINTISITDAKHKISNKTENKTSIEYASLAREKDIINNEKQKVANMEMVIAVVGTTKAGKSTIINALVGQEILPNCELPMTSLPTLVTHKKGKIIPTLRISKPLPLIKLRQQIINTLKTTQSASQTTFIHSPTGQQLCKQLQDISSLPITNHYEGQIAIFAILQHLNNLIWMAKILNITIPYDNYQQISQLPRVEVEFFHLKHNKHFQQARLSFLDTSGSNQHGKNNTLSPILQQQLESSSVILLAIDYTQMNSEADDVIRKKIKQIHSQQGQKLLVFVNKFDNANKNTLNSNQTKTYVSQQLMHNILPKKHVFPVSSWWGYLANKALMTLETSHEINPSDDWVKDFGEAALGRCWQQKITHQDEVKIASQALWHDSKFSNPINEIITNIHTQSAVECLGISLKKMGSLLKKLKKNINHDLTAIKQNTFSSQEKINTINKEITKLKSIKKQINDKESLVIHEANKKIANSNNKHIRKAVKITNVFIETGYKENQLIAGINRKDQVNSLYAKIEKAENNKITYKNRDGAIYLLNDMQCYINSIKRNLLEKSDSILHTNIKEAEKNINGIFDDNFRAMLNKTIKSNHLNSYGCFILPKFICKKHIESLQIKNLISVGIEEKKSIRHRTYVNNKVLHSVNDTWGKKTHEKEMKKFKVNINKIKKYIHKDMTDYTTSIENYHKKYLEENIINKIKEDTHKVKHHINIQYNELTINLRKITLKNKKNQLTISILEKANKHIEPLIKEIKNQLTIIQEIPKNEISSSSSKEKLGLPA